MSFQRLTPIIDDTTTKSPTVQRNEALPLSRIPEEFKHENASDYKTGLKMNNATHAFLLTGYQGGTFGSLSPNQTFTRNYEIVSVTEFIRREGKITTNQLKLPFTQSVYIVTF